MKCLDCPFYVDTGSFICELAAGTNIMGYPRIVDGYIRKRGWEGEICRARKMFIAMRDEIRELNEVVQLQKTEIEHEHAVIEKIQSIIDDY